MSETDRERLIHMLDASREAISFLEGQVAGGFGKDRVVLLAVIKAIEIIGEAARHVSAGQRSKMSEIPWAKVIGMRNQLSHGYFDWDLDVIWATVHENLPVLILQLEKALEAK